MKERLKTVYPRIVERRVTKGADGYSAVVISEETAEVTRLHTGSAGSFEGAHVALQQLSRDVFLAADHLDNPR